MLSKHALFDHNEVWDGTDGFVTRRESPSVAAPTLSTSHCLDAVSHGDLQSTREISCSLMDFPHIVGADFSIQAAPCAVGNSSAFHALATYLGTLFFFQYPPTRRLTLVKLSFVTVRDLHRSESLLPSQQLVILPLRIAHRWHRLRSLLPSQSLVTLRFVVARR
jgi:hypothetical protein